MPLMVDYMKTMDTRNDQRAREIQASFNHLAQHQQEQFSQLQLLTSGSLIFRLETAHPPAPRLGLEPAPAALPAPQSAESSQYTSARASIAPEPEPGLKPDLEHEMPPPPKYRMCRAVRTMKAL